MLHLANFLSLEPLLKPTVQLRGRDVAIVSVLDHLPNILNLDFVKVIDHSFMEDPKNDLDAFDIVDLHVNSGCVFLCPVISRELSLEGLRVVDQNLVRDFDGSNESTAHHLSTRSNEFLLVIFRAEDFYSRLAL